MNASRRRAASRISRLARAEAPVVRRATPAPVPVVVRTTGPAIPAPLAEQFAAGKLSQRCPEPGCPTVEAAGFCSTCHDRRTGPADWFRQSLSKAQKEARRTRGHSTPETGATALETASPERLTLADGFWF